MDKDNDIAWDPAFFQALQLELEAYLEVLHFESEHQLTTEPLKIDVLIIKKLTETVIDNPITQEFRRYNVFEFKSPADYVSVDDFYKGLVYVLLYKVLNKLDIKDISLSFVAMKHPQSVIAHVQKAWGWKVTEQRCGIYGVTGTPFPIQLIETKRLSAENNLFLYSLRNDLSAETLEQVVNAALPGRRVAVSAYIDVLLRANKQKVREALQIMKYPTLMEVFEEAGVIARVEAELRKQIEADIEKQVKQAEKIRLAQKLINKGWDPAEIAEMTELDFSTVESLYETAQA
ncbi:MAG: hypothetical protein LBD29_03830 [Treponema sp.]|nr:hypothetical protein [Treponema sp.]